MATTLRGRGTPGQIADLLFEGITRSAISCELIDRIERKAGNETVILLVFEKYYMRSQNRASLSVLITGSDGEVLVDAVGAGGGTGVFLRFSWGTEDDFEQSVCDILLRKGFVRL